MEFCPAEKFGELTCHHDNGTETSLNRRSKSKVQIVILQYIKSSWHLLHRLTPTDVPGQCMHKHLIPEAWYRSIATIATDNKTHWQLLGGGNSSTLNILWSGDDRYIYPLWLHPPLARRIVSSSVLCCECDPITTSSDSLQPPLSGDQRRFSI